MKLTFLLSTLPLAFASSPPIAGFVPQTSVTDHNAIDLDQALIEEYVASEATFPLAKQIYEDGAHSKSVARITFVEGTSLPQDLPKGTKVTGVATDGSTTVVGFLYKAYEQNAQVIEIQYEVIDIQEKYVNCQVGGRQETGNLEGCFAESGAVSIDGIGGTFQYTYVPSLDNTNGRTIQGFSTDADSKMRVNGDGDYYVDFQKFYNYYGRADYADNWIQAAFNGDRTDFTNGNNDFTGFGIDAKSEGVKKGSNYMAIAMYVIRELEDAIDDCNRGCSTEACNDDAVHALDEAVAFYTGSLEGPAPGGSGEGVLLHRLANKRCPQFQTCNPATNNAVVNDQIFLEFEKMKNALVGSATPQCVAARMHKERIAQLLFVPMIQGTIRYAYILGTGPDDDNVKAKAEGAVFAASVLPVVNACNAEAASTIYNNMKLNSNRPNFDAVKTAFESTYDCMGIQCSDVGGYWNEAEQTYWAGAEPCGQTNLQSSKNGSKLSTGAIIGIVVGCIAFVGIVAYLVCGKKQNQVEFKSDGANPPPSETSHV